MKLFDRYSRISISATILIYISVSVIFYLLFNTILLSLNDRDLSIERDEIKAYKHRHGKLPELYLERNQIIRYKIVDTPIQKEIFTSINSKVLQKPFRKLTFGIVVDKQPYEISIMKPLEDKNRLLKIILQVTLIALAIVLLINFLINRIFTKRLWKPFYDTLLKIQEFELNKEQEISFPQAKITEFHLLNSSFEKTFKKARKDYTHLKEFTENVSHELQTPLSIIRLKLDLLIQENELSKKQFSIAQGAYLAVQRLVKLNNSLLLLMKIENGQFEQQVPVRMKEAVTEKLEEFEALIASKSLGLILFLNDADVKINAALCEILLNNLLSNAIEHNMESGIIRVELLPGCLTISNTGANSNALNEKKLFKRFLKSDAESQRNGLGLAIVKEICDASGIKITYSFREGFHFFRLSWQ